MNGRNLALGAVAGIATLSLAKRATGSRSSDTKIALKSVGVTVHPRNEWPAHLRVRGAGEAGPCPADLHTTQASVHAVVVADKERRILANEEPAVSVVHAGSKWWVFDGHHALVAYRRLGKAPACSRYDVGRGDPIAAPRLEPMRPSDPRGSRSEWAELGRAGLPAPARKPSTKKLVHIVSLPDLARIWRDREGGATGDLVAWVEVDLGAGPSYREGIPVDDLLDRMRDWAWGESDAIAVERCHEELVLLAKHFNRLRFPLTVYRGLEVYPKTIVDVQESGDHWTPNRAVALAFAEGRHQSSHRERTGDDGGEPVLLSGTISGPHAVRWRETFNGYFDYTVDHAGDPEVAEEQVATSLVHDVQIVPLPAPRVPRRSRAKRGSRATVRATAQRFEAMVDGDGALLPLVPSWTAVRQRLLVDGFTVDSDLGTTFAEICVEALDTLKRKQPDAALLPAPQRAPTPKNAETLAWIWVKWRYESFVESAARFTDPLVLFREVTARDAADVRIDGVGLFWSWDPEAAEAHWARGGAHWLLVARVAARHVDWMATTVQNVRMPYEREITLYPGSPVHLLRIRGDAGVHVVDEMGTA